MKFDALIKVIYTRKNPVFVAGMSKKNFFALLYLTI